MKPVKLKCGPGKTSCLAGPRLSLGACLGGNGTMIRASANLVTIGLAEKAGYRISSVEYMKAYWWPMMITVTICMVYLLACPKNDLDLVLPNEAGNYMNNKNMLRRHYGHH